MTAALDARLAALAEAVDLAEGRLDAAAVQRGRDVVARAGARLGLGVDTTVIALAGPTGAGKSTLFNALVGEDVVTAGVRRPTTASVTAAARGDVDPALLDWLGAARRHTLSGDGAGLVLLDLPDYDSVETAHRREVERIIELVDLLVWVADPQKYADAALHDRYLKPLSGYGEAMMVVLNQADRLADGALDACRADLRRLLAEDGLPKLPVLAVSALDGRGMDELRATLEQRVAARAAAVARLSADVTEAAGGLDAGCDGRAGKIAGGDRRALVEALGSAAGVPLVVRAVAVSHRREGSLAAGWPFARWAGRLRRDPLKRLRLGDAGAHTSIPRATPAQRGLASSAVRTLAATAADGLPEPWPGLLRAAALRTEATLPEQLDRALAGVDVQPRRPRWWSAAGLVQRALAVVVAAGVLWLAVLAGLGMLQLDDVLPLPEWEGIPVPTLLLAGGALAGLLLAGIARWLNGVGARRRARSAQRRLHAAVERVAGEHVVAPVQAELALREDLCRALSAARR